MKQRVMKVSMCTKDGHQAKVTVRVRYGGSFGKLMLSSRREDDVLLEQQQVVALFGGQAITTIIGQHKVNIQKVK